MHRILVICFCLVVVCQATFRFGPVIKHSDTDEALSSNSKQAVQLELDATAQSEAQVDALLEAAANARASTGVKFEGEEHRSICRDALTKMNLWFSTIRVNIISLTVVKHQEVGWDEVAIDIFANGRKVDRLKKSVRKGDVWKIDRTITVSDSFLASVWEEDRGTDVYVDADDLIGNINPSISDLKDIATKGARDFTVKNGGAEYVLKLSVDSAGNSTTTPSSPTTGGGTDGKGKSIRLLALRCIAQEDFVGQDDPYLEIYADGTKTDTVTKRMKKGDVWNLNKVVNFNTELKIKLYEQDRGKDSKVDADDYLGEVVYRKADDHPIHVFKQDGAEYQLVSEPASNSASFLEMSTELGSVPVTDLKRVNTGGGNVYDITFADICALAGDFYAGSDPAGMSIGYNVAARAKRSDAEMMSMFKKVFESWFTASDDNFGLKTSRTVRLLDLERNAIARHREHPDVSISRAYAEHESPYGGNSLEHVTNSHNNNFAKVHLPQSETPDIDYYMTSVKMGLAADKLTERGSMFYINALSNYDHFLEGWADEVYKAGHKIALQTAVAAAKETDSNKKAILYKTALAQEAHALHFGTDLFSGGHQRSAKRTLFEDRATAGTTGCGNSDAKAIKYVNIQAAIFHDEDGDVGVWVANDHKTWRAYGDRQYWNKGHETGREQAALFARESITDVINAYKGSCPSAEACWGLAATRPKGAYSYIPYFHKAKKDQFPPVFVKKGTVWYYRSVPFDTPIAPSIYNGPVNAQFERFYTRRWDCQSLVIDFYGDVTNKDRYDARSEVYKRSIAKEEDLVRTYFNVMDLDDDSEVTLLEFKRWLEVTVPVLRGAENNMMKSVYMMKFFQKWSQLDKNTITVEDLEWCISYSFSNNPSTSDDDALVLSIRHFVITEFAKIVQEESKKDGGSFLQEQMLSASVNLVRSNSGERTTRSTSGGGGAIPAGCGVDGVKVNFCNVQNKAKRMVKYQKKFKNMDQNDFNKKLKSLKKAGLVADSAVDKDVETLLDWDIVHVVRELRFKKVLKRDNVVAEFKPKEEQYWAGVAILNGLDPTPEATRDNSPEKRFIAALPAGAVAAFRASLTAGSIGPTRADGSPVASSTYSLIASLGAGALNSRDANGGNICLRIGSRRCSPFGDPDRVFVRPESDTERERRINDRRERTGLPPVATKRPESASV